MVSPSCYICKAEVQDTDKKTHLRSEWHIYNLKRTVASLPPLSEMQFLKKHGIFSSLGAEFANNELQDKSSWHCESCGKTFHSNKSYENHVKSRKHKSKLKVLEQKSEILTRTDISNVQGSVSTYINGDDEEGFDAPLLIGGCLFCDISYSSLPKPEYHVLRHMKGAHNFEVPFPNKLVHADLLLNELGSLVKQQFTCLGCGKQFLGRSSQESLKAVRMHMIDKCHNFLYTGQQDPAILALAVDEAANERENYIPPIARIGGELYSQFYALELADKTLVWPNVVDEDDEIYWRPIPKKHRRFHQLQGPEMFAIADYSRQLVDPNAMARNPSRLAEELKIAKQSKYSLKLGIRGNDFLRGHLRRQYL